jgi:hypothetical protein
MFVVAYLDDLQTRISQATANWKECAEFAKAVCDLAWDRLHTSNWKTVDDCWRRLFGVCKLVLALASMSATNSTATTSDTLRNGDRITEPVIDATVRELDYVVIMSVPELAEFAKQMINRLELELEESKSNSNDNDNDNDDNNKRRKTDTATSTSSSFSLLGAVGRGGIPFDVPRTLFRNTTPIQRVHCPSLLDFESLYHEKSVPVIITGAIDHWPALNEHRWHRYDARGRTRRERHDVSYLRRVAGRRLVPIELGAHYLARRWSQRLMPFAEFLDRYILNDDVDDDSRDAKRTTTTTTTGSKTTVDRVDNGDNNEEQDENEDDSVVEIGYLAQTRLFDQIDRLRNDISIPDYCAMSGESGLRRLMRFVINSDANNNKKQD